MKKLLLSILAIASICLASCSGPEANNNNNETTINPSDMVVENIMARRSIRKYKTDTLPQDILDKIIECGINAPNGRNQQNYEVKVVTDPASTAYLAEQLNGMYKAPAYLFIASKNEYDMSKIDVGLLSENICLSACAFGIGSICLGMPVRSLLDQPELLKKFNFSEGHEICLVIALGYPDEAPEAKPRNPERVQYMTILP